MWSYLAVHTSVYTLSSLSDQTTIGTIKTVANTMIDGQLQLLIISVLFQCLTSAENTSCSTCMADIYGPYPENQTIISSVAIVRATESDPGVIVCRYQCYDQDYNFDLGIDILDPKRQFPIQKTPGLSINTKTQATTSQSSLTMSKHVIYQTTSMRRSENIRHMLVVQTPQLS